MATKYTVLTPIGRFTEGQVVDESDFQAGTNFKYLLGHGVLSVGEVPLDETAQLKTQVEQLKSEIIQLKSTPVTVTLESSGVSQTDLDAKQAEIDQAYATIEAIIPGTASALGKLPVENLRAVAKHRNIEGADEMNKDDILKLLEPTVAPDPAQP